MEVEKIRKMTTEKFKKDKPDIDVFDSDTHRVDPPRSTLQITEETADETERRWKPAKSSDQSGPGIFLQEDPNVDSRYLTPEAAGIKVVIKGEKPSGEGVRPHEGAHDYEK